MSNWYYFTAINKVFLLSYIYGKRQLLQPIFKAYHQNQVMLLPPSLEELIGVEQNRHTPIDKKVQHRWGK